MAMDGRYAGNAGAISGDAVDGTRLYTTTAKAL
jgi:hypothetical protein